MFVVQEGRGFNNLFAGFPGAQTTMSGYTHTGKIVRLHAVRLGARAPQVDAADAFWLAVNHGKMNGFDLITDPPSLAPYAYVDRSQVRPYWNLAKQYALADHMFSESTTGSFVASLYTVAATSAIGPGNYVVGFPTMRPWGCDAPVGTVVRTTRGSLVYPCFTFPSMALLLDAANRSWKYYAPLRRRGYGAFAAIKAVGGGKDASKIVSPETLFFNDLATGQLPNFSWIEPSFANSDDGGAGGPAWLSRIVAATQKSPYWKSTAIVVAWDEDSGWYDETFPPILDPVSDGFRVPLIVISPYAKRGYISHTQYETASVLRFAEQQWNLGSLGADDVRANSIQDMLNL